jgi:hypothetical protein
MQRTHAQLVLLIPRFLGRASPFPRCHGVLLWLLLLIPLSAVFDYDTHMVLRTVNLIEPDYLRE